MNDNCPSTLAASKCVNNMVLWTFIDEAYRQYRSERGSHDCWDCIEAFFFDKNKCLRMLYHILDLGHNHYNQIMPDNLYRCQHTFVTFLLGWGIAKRYSLLKGINVFNKMPDEYLWVLTSLIHDYGYIKAGIANEVSLKELDGRYHLLSDTCAIKQLDSTIAYSSKFPQYLTYSYDTISNYYNYRLSSLKSYSSKDSEVNDHGIYGGCKCYEEYCDFYINYEYPRSCVTKHDDADEIRRMGYKQIRVNNRPEIVQSARTEPLLYKTACLITAQHNMYKSSDPKTDSEYEKFGLRPLISTNPIAIDKSNPLLFLLSLVDTVECTKRFEGLFSIKKVLDIVQIQLDDDGIIIDYSSLSNVFHNYHSLFNSKKKRSVLNEELDKQVGSVIGLKDWVKCETRILEPFCVKIQF